VLNAGILVDEPFSAKELAAIDVIPFGITNSVEFLSSRIHASLDEES
jgi:hypothetical protein